MEIDLDPLADPDEIVAVAEKLAVTTASWRPGQAGALARENWAEVAEPTIAEFGRLLSEVFARGSAGKMSATAQDRAISLYDRLRRALPEAGVFFDRQAEHVNKMRARARTRERDARRRQEMAAAKVQRFEILAHPDDVKEIREFVQAKLKARDIKLPEIKQRGRPRKGAAAEPLTTAPAEAPETAPEPVPETAPTAPGSDPLQRRREQTKSLGMLVGGVGQPARKK